jgi:hypothetical protein
MLPTEEEGHLFVNKFLEKIELIPNKDPTISTIKNDPATITIPIKAFDSLDLALSLFFSSPDPTIHSIPAIMIIKKNIKPMIINPNLKRVLITPLGFVDRVECKTG